MSDVMYVVSIFGAPVASFADEDDAQDAVNLILAVSEDLGSVDEDFLIEEVPFFTNTIDDESVDEIVELFYAEDPEEPEAL